MAIPYNSTAQDMGWAQQTAAQNAIVRDRESICEVLDSTLEFARSLRRKSMELRAQMTGPELENAKCPEPAQPRGLQAYLLEIRQALMAADTTLDGIQKLF